MATRSPARPGAPPSTKDANRRKGKGVRAEFFADPNSCMGASPSQPAAMTVAATPSTRRRPRDHPSAAPCPQPSRRTCLKLSSGRPRQAVRAGTARPHSTRASAGCAPPAATWRVPRKPFEKPSSSPLPRPASKRRSPTCCNGGSDHTGLCGLGCARTASEPLHCRGVSSASMRRAPSATISASIRA